MKYLVLLAPLALAGCLDPRDYESVPVEIETRSGTVTCQLYTEEYTIWDRAIIAPPGVTIAQADEVCREYGRDRVNR